MLIIHLSGSRTTVPTTAPKPKPPPGPDPGPEPEESAEDPNPDPLPNPRNEQCSRGLVFDAATSIRGDLFFFKNGYILIFITIIMFERDIYAITSFPHFNNKILTRYYWRKSRAAIGIRFTKVKTKWSQINYVDAAFEVPSKDVVYLFEGNIHNGSVRF